MLASPETLGPHLMFDKDIMAFRGALNLYQSQIRATLLGPNQSSQQLERVPGIDSTVQLRPESMHFQLALLLHSEPALGIHLCRRQPVDSDSEGDDYAELMVDDNDSNSDFYKLLVRGLFDFNEKSEQFKLMDTILEDSIMLKVSLHEDALVNDGPHTDIDLSWLAPPKEISDDTETDSQSTTEGSQQDITANRFGHVIIRSYLSNLIAGKVVFWPPQKQPKRPVSFELLDYEQLAALTGENNNRRYRPFGIEEYAGMAERVFQDFMDQNPDIKKEYSKIVTNRQDASRQVYRQGYKY